MSSKRLSGLLGPLSAALAAAAMAAAPMAASAEPQAVKVAVIVPLSGPWARSGEVHLMGAKAAVEDINASGGIKALGGAKMELVVADAGDSIEKSKNAAQRLVAQEPDLIGGTGAFLSSFTLAITEVTERASLPWLTLSYADSLTSRGYKYVFQTSAPASVQSESMLPIITKLAQQVTGKPAKTVGIVMDNTASQVSFTKPMREGGLERAGLKLVTDEVFTPPLSDATSLVQKLRNTRPDFALMMPSTVPDAKLLLEKVREMGLGKGRIPLIASGGNMVVPELLKIVDKETLEGLIVAVANWPGKGSEALVEAFKKRTGEPWMTQDSLSTYGDIWIFKEALEKAGVADRKKVAEAMRSMDTDTGPSAYYPGERLRFDEKGRRVGAEVVLVQWQDGLPVPVYPPNLALGELKWPKR
ncbi:ABC transporter substrate-binding protein [Pollutimonas bauzanensis]|uniref:Branched-chain amino acid transport system substrate-binding protein n=1 Tax=Pollutimonas bauzanensis TaxID=658167 RepID=A0A1M5R2G0_9BURK|nr:ABC transporter substrate-binding protein [Pollutimonas bauzanensis]SHH20286.1 branched-chain amino acid transport system substrate-binding protein [Pollutimonas bauzanensis]